MKTLCTLLLTLAAVACSGDAGAPTDTADTATVPEPALAVVATFDPALGQLPEGLALHEGAAYVGFAVLGQVHRVDLADGAMTLFADVPPLPPDLAFITGLEFDDAGQLYVALPSFTPDPVAGVYRSAPEGGAATVFASDPGLVFPSDSAFHTSGDLYVTDSATGSVFRTDASGTTELWLSDPLLVGGREICGNTEGLFDIGANGIAVTDDAVYAANTDQATIVRIPIAADGAAGTAEVFAGPDCDALGGIDGIALDTDGGFYVALNRQNRIARVDPDGTVTSAVEDPVFDFPASVRIGDVEGRRALFVTNFALSTAMAGGDARPSLVRWWLPEAP